MESYKEFVRKNRDFVQSLESLANGVTWILPERFSNSEIGPEAVYAILGIISSVNQYIIDTTPKKLLQYAPTISSFPWPLCVSILKDLEAVVEVAAEHFLGDTGKWNFIAVTETTKAIVRLASLRDHGYKMLLQGGELANDNKGQNTLETHHDELSNSGMPGGYGGRIYFKDSHVHDPNTLEGRALSALSRFRETARLVSDPMFLNSHSQIPVQPVEKPSISSIWSEKGLVGGLFLSGEILHILRPLIYVLLIKKFGMKSWKPWLSSLFVDITSMGFLTYVTQSRNSNKNNFVSLSISEKDELKRRKLLWALYIIRDPFFKSYARNRLEYTEKHLNQIPLVGLLTGKLVELIIGAQSRYTYTSGS